MKQMISETVTLMVNASERIQCLVEDVADYDFTEVTDSDVVTMIHLIDAALCESRIMARKLEKLKEMINAAH